MDLATIRWYVNEIENWALSGLAKERAHRMSPIISCLESALDGLQSFARSEPERACEIGYQKCPDGSCRPKCT
jgi:hypothetical protein